MDRGMQYRPEYRPEYRLDRLRMIMLDCRNSSNGQQEGEPLLHLRWLRTMVVDLSHTAEADVGQRQALQQRSAEGEADDRLTLQLRSGWAVQRVICKELCHNDHLHSRLMPFLARSAQILTSLDLRGCDYIDDEFLFPVADGQSSSLRRLHLPPCCSVTQWTLDRFTQLEELDASGCDDLTNVDFCSATLRVLYANWCSNLTDVGLRRATQLEVLHVGNCSKVTDVSPFARCLLELDASEDCGIGSDALSDCRRLQVLNAYSNDNNE